ncbi:Eukaryotic peptide chain release factor GTP-binding subunit [Astathelohania contejeani]|uniref:Eukaryotic peptide chain release factor GTP-binding subunit n=1 Tax=Astathelohania contejeani TaxID=164912 RepID=A0ABQ7I108_9MICR|nr:Eukaryotic peptide chain release factor GTP-binding subunit [Thelohania contejeani]
MNSQKPIINIVFIGHVDAGKSTIAGQILCQLGLIDPRTLQKYIDESAALNRGSWYLSWALDKNEEERERGKTVEVGRAAFELPDRRVNILDAPGHKLYVADMIDGANQADVAVLVVSARTNEFEAGFEKGGQTREHVLLARTGKINRLVVLVNKMDTVNWSQTRFQDIQKRLTEYLKKLYKDTPVSFIPISGFQGINIKDKSKDISWYTGESFLEYLNKLEIDRDYNSPFIISITEKIKALGNTYLTGRMECGAIHTSDEVKILPKGINTTCLLYDEDENEIEKAYAGEIIKLKFKDVELDVGDMVCHPCNTELKVCTEFTCTLNILETKNIISPGYSCILHLRMMAKPCKIVEFRNVVNGKVVKKHFVRKGEQVMAKIRCDTPIVLVETKDKSRIDRFSLRDEGMTVGIGIVRRII